MTDCVLCSKGDFDQIVSDLADFWGHDRTRALHHPMFINEFGDCAHVFREGERVVAYLFGFVTPGAAPIGYIHLVAVRQSHRHLGLARRLYDHFTALARSRGCRRLRAITSPENARSIRFHQSLGFRPRASLAPATSRSSRTTEGRASFAWCSRSGSTPRTGPRASRA
jgi:ribosomal protein S18 acetylase RimI-like enzyme